MVLAEKLMDLLQANPLFAKIEVAKPGFINFYLADKELQAILKMVQTKKTTFGQGEKKNFKYNLELVSATQLVFYTLVMLVMVWLVTVLPAFSNLTGTMWKQNITPTMPETKSMF
jgi:hypothetical protein